MRLGWATLIGAGAGKLRPAFAESLALQHLPAPPQHPQTAMSEPKATGRAADFTLRIAPTMVELAPQVVISTIGYNSKVPGPLMRMREGQSVTVDVVNDTDVPEYSALAWPIGSVGSGWGGDSTKTKRPIGRATVSFDDTPKAGP